MAWVEIHGYAVLKQDEGFSCAMACAGMIVNLVQGGKPTENVIKQMSSGIGGTGRYRADLKDKATVGGMRMLPTGNEIKGQSLGSKQSNSLGTNCDHIGKILAAYKIKNTAKRFRNVRTVFSGASRSRPAIGLVNWANGGGGHFVVVQFVHDKLLIRDPIYGVTSIINDGRYTSARGHQATFNGWAVQTHG